jgi:hypothetical protein
MLHCRDKRYISIYKVSYAMVIICAFAMAAPALIAAVPGWQIWLVR